MTNAMQISRMKGMEKDASLTIRLNRLDKKEIEAAAYSEGKSVSDYLIFTHKLYEKDKRCPYCGSDVKKRG